MSVKSLFDLEESLSEPLLEQNPLSQEGQGEMIVADKVNVKGGIFGQSTIVFLQLYNTGKISLHGVGLD